MMEDNRVLLFVAFAAFVAGGVLNWHTRAEAPTGDAPPVGGHYMPGDVEFNSTATKPCAWVLQSDMKWKEVDCINAALVLSEILARSMLHPYNDESYMHNLMGRRSSSDTPSNPSPLNDEPVRPHVSAFNYIDDTTTIADMIYEDVMSDKYKGTEPFVGCTTRGTVIIANIITNITNFDRFDGLCKR
jgi:hypothetical protein